MSRIIRSVRSRISRSPEMSNHLVYYHQVRQETTSKPFENQFIYRSSVAYLYVIIMLTQPIVHRQIVVMRDSAILEGRSPSKELFDQISCVTRYLCTIQNKRLPALDMNSNNRLVAVDYTFHSTEDSQFARHFNMTPCPPLNEAICRYIEMFGEIDYYERPLTKNPCQDDSKYLLDLAHSASIRTPIITTGKSKFSEIFEQKDLPAKTTFSKRN